MLLSHAGKQMSKELELNYFICALNFYLNSGRKCQSRFSLFLSAEISGMISNFQKDFHLLWPCASCEVCPAFFMPRTVLLKSWEIPHACL